MTKTTRYANVLSRIGAERSALIPMAKLRTLTESKNIGEIVAQLQETSYAEKASKLNSPYNSRKLERLFQESLIDAYAKIIKNSPSRVRRFLGMYLLAFEYENVKTLLKAIAAELPLEEKRSRIYLSAEEYLERQKLFEEASEASDLKTFADILKKEDYSSAINLGLKRFEENGETQLFDILMDKAYYEYVWWTFCQLPKKEKPHAAFYVSITYDGFILDTLLRGKALGYDAHWLRMVIPHNFIDLTSAAVDAMITAADFEATLNFAKTTPYSKYFSKADTPQETIATAEKAFKKAIFNHARENRLTEVFNLGAPLAFMMEKEAEARNLSAICLGVENRWKSENIQNNLLFPT